ncbi:hypothetical protein N0B31_02700 [Salinirubellus salinus]|uniref:Uncharacterized protein n=1 Tax=Salinirubellus salinus TaxID=1364945 RepID=A0A9E7U5A9_9EURY|nr:hypothetical protein [Salinirubellus salinus]UWM55200.1 hypothetical protein N0B31_02700 [Salinirubellus salinus]
MSQTQAASRAMQAVMEDGPLTPFGDVGVQESGNSPTRYVALPLDPAIALDLDQGSTVYRAYHAETNTFIFSTTPLFDLA